MVSVGKNIAWVVLDRELAPRLAQLKRMTGKRSMLAPGDVVHVTVLEDEKTLVDRIEPRTFTLERRTVDGRAKTMAANVDTMVTVTALADPPPRLTTLDQLLAFAELAHLRAIVLFSKPDLVDSTVRRTLVDLYAGLGYDALVINPKTGNGGADIDALRGRLHGRHALLCGVSGVGKSTMFKALGGEATIGDVSRFGLGRQTTSAARLYRLDDGFLIDSPGVAEFGLGRIDAGELIGGFREMGEPSTHCRFSDCSHLHEPDCGVKAAVAAGNIAASRYASFRKILEAMGGSAVGRT
ncbi:MAG: ribosome small subunit-dependent GTPase A [Candidatus Eremiobacteraeota bacterium]|nr:ribosome small subunit-dependent GTPase A [Candidatus Eremiobacteraeota bacterium]